MPETPRNQPGTEPTHPRGARRRRETGRLHRPNPMASRAAQRRARQRQEQEAAGGEGPSRARESRAQRLRQEYPAWDRVLSDFFRPSWGQAMVAVVLCLVGILLVTQVRSKDMDNAYASMRRTDLVQLLDQLNAEESRLTQERNRLERTREQLATGADARRVAEQENQKRLDQLGILAGTLPATGPGVRITIADPQGKVTPETLLDAVEEMRDAGAEAIEVNDQVRVVASSWFARKGDDLVVDGVALQAPYVLDVIGDEHALDEGARFRGGLVSQVQAQEVGGRVLISRLEQVEIRALHTTRAPEFAKPA
ncbi:DUF881 domain-containing protein [Luteococcus sp. OSA5]|uniref:DUF881 domain-containing protein n=1 Tax=Luteococcus sp. OSA5 TaxID=3401630 RepID=UPI003B42DCB2